jgi:hypothetical protein
MKSRRTTDKCSGGSIDKGLSDPHAPEGRKVVVQIEDQERGGAGCEDGRL